MNVLVKNVKKYGNSGGIYLPSEWIGGQVSVELVRKPLDPRTDLTKMNLEHVIAVVIYGSYARGEIEPGSDVDVILVTDVPVEVPADIRNRYDVQVKTQKQMSDAMADPIFYKSIIDSSAAITNSMFLEDLKSSAHPDKKSIRLRVELAESSLALTSSIMEDYEGSEELIYPLVMRLKEMIILGCLFSGKKYTTKLLRKEMLVSGISRSQANAAIAIYRAIRDNKKHITPIPKDTIGKLISALEKKINYVKQKAE